MQKTWFKILAISLGCGIGIASVEAVFWLTKPPLHSYYIRRPFQTHVFQPQPEALPGISGASVFTVNSLGLRGPEMATAKAKRILVLGGSTAECLYLDDSEAWPALLSKKIHHWLGPNSAWVVNGGKSGMTSREHIVQAELLLPHLPKFDLVILLVGVNDLSLRIAKEDQYEANAMQTPAGRASAIRRAFAIRPQPSLPWYKNLAIWQLARRFKWQFQHQSDDAENARQDKNGEAYIKWRQARQNATRIIDELPDLSASIAEYRTNLETYVKLVQKSGAEVVLLTQPYLWQANMGEDLKKLLWAGARNAFPMGEEYYSAAAIAGGMARYNQTLLEFCADKDIYCFDLAAKIPKTAKAFYDGVHFNESGSLMVAKAVYHFLEDAKLVGPRLTTQKKPHNADSMH